MSAPLDVERKKQGRLGLQCPQGAAIGCVQADQRDMYGRNGCSRPRQPINGDSK